MSNLLFTKPGGRGNTEVALYYIDFDDPDEDIMDTFRIRIKVED